MGWSLTPIDSLEVKALIFVGSLTRRIKENMDFVFCSLLVSEEHELSSKGLVSPMCLLVFLFAGYVSHVYGIRDASDKSVMEWEEIATEVDTMPAFFLFGI